MPRQNKRRRSRKRRTRKTTPRTAVLSVQPALYPRTRRVKLRYSTKLLLVPPVGNLYAEHVFRANSVFDPDLTGVGHQPRGFDEMNLFYERWRVVGSKIKVYGAGVQSDDMYVGVFNGGLENSMLFTGPSDFLPEVSQVAYKWVAASTHGTSSAFNFQKSYNPKKMSGYTATSPEYTGSVAADPAIVHHFVVFCALPQQIAAGTAQAMNVVIDYDVMFFDPKIILPS